MEWSELINHIVQSWTKSFYSSSELHIYMRIIVMCGFLGGQGDWFNIKMASYQHMKAHCAGKTILQPSYLHNAISYTGKMTSL